MKQIRVSIEFLYDQGESIEDWDIEAINYEGEEVLKIDTLNDAISVAHAELNTNNVWDFDFKAEFIESDQEIIPNSEEIAKAKKVLRKAGYYVDNLWNIEDVSNNYISEDGELDEEECQEVLNSTLQNDYFMQNTWETMAYVADTLGYKNKED